ncbi:phosphonate metabolism transcriptional regulator PhnF [Salibacterium qingdaonense]|uniref:Transcriptional regulator, GntR family n=1 Tax=Salibacterium qingdaonense TaxID=266892 RepID=A0A1I4P0F9_9BACI|nr:phosphonate metabolism transcriptional regulator PhnF [Salibacterium qingdaonense]SFM21126.1 transcriptional regulator, GntR family [Salibacterium qingdaonense]
MIDKNSPLPIYYQIQEMIRKKIETGEWNPGDMLPSERIFSEDFDVSRMTVRQAVTELANEGVLMREKGKGTFVAEPKIEQPLQGLTSFTEDMKARGLEPGSTLIQYQLRTAPRKAAEALQIKPETKVYEIKRVRLADDVPMAYETTFINRELAGDIPEDVENRSIYSFLEQEKGVKIVDGEQTFEASLANTEEAERLAIEEGAPVLLIQRITYLEDGSPLEYVKSAYRGDRYKFTINMPR